MHPKGAQRSAFNEYYLAPRNTFISLQGTVIVNLCHELPEGFLGTKSTVLVLALRFSPEPSIQMYMHWVFFEAVMSSFIKLRIKVTML